MKEPRNLGGSLRKRTYYTLGTPNREKLAGILRALTPARTEDERAAPPRMYKIAHLSGKSASPISFDNMQPTIFREVAFPICRSLALFAAIRRASSFVSRLGDVAALTEASATFFCWPSNHILVAVVANPLLFRLFQERFLEALD